MNPHQLLELQKTQFFHDLSTDEMNALFKDAKYRDVANHKALFSQGQDANSFAVVFFGGFKILRVAHKNEKSILHFGVPGDLLGAMFMTQANSIYSVSVIAMGPSAAIEVPKNIFLENWEGNSKIRGKLKNHFFQRIQEMQIQQLQSKRSLKAKIASLFLWLIKQEHQEGNILIPIPITRQEIADFTGASVESVIRNMSSMSQIIATKDKSIAILDLNALRVLASNGEN